MPQPKAVILTTGFGHWSLTLAMKEVLGKMGFETSHIKNESVINELYKIVYRAAPKQNKQVYQLVANNKAARSWIMEGLTLKNKNLITQLDKIKPQVVISNYYEYTPVLGEIKKKCNCPVFNFMANPVTQVEELELSKHARNIVFDKQSVVPSKLSNYSIYPLGWIVQDKFEKEYHQEEIKSALGLSNKATLMFVSGSLGSPADQKIFRSIVRQDMPIQILYACGSNKLLKNKIMIMLKNTKLNNCSIKLLGFTQNIHRYLQAADLVVGKAGPNTIFETVATKTPFFASHHLPGQEDGNLDVITRYQLGWVEESSKKATQKILKLLSNPTQIKAFERSLDKMALHNQEAKQKFGKLVVSAVESN
jgi:UDP-N-acetylglucosamine:LPS N-acetylglucosamine transferase